MTDQEKLVWKVEIFKMCEDTDDIIEIQKKSLDEQRAIVKSIIQDSKNVITTYEEAVDRIGNVARARKIKFKSPEALESSPKKHNSDSDLASFSPDKKKNNNKKKTAVIEM